MDCNKTEIESFTVNYGTFDKLKDPEREYDLAIHHQIDLVAKYWKTTKDKETVRKWIEASNALELDARGDSAPRLLRELELDDEDSIDRVKLLESLKNEDSGNCLLSLLDDSAVGFILFIECTRDGYKNFNNCSCDITSKVESYKKWIGIVIRNKKDFKVVFDYFKLGKVKPFCKQHDKMWSLLQKMYPSWYAEFLQQEKETAYRNKRRKYANRLLYLRKKKQKDQERLEKQQKEEEKIRKQEEERDRKQQEEEKIRKQEQEQLANREKERILQQKELEVRLRKEKEAALCRERNQKEEEERVRRERIEKEIYFYDLQIQKMDQVIQSIDGEKNSLLERLKQLECLVSEQDEIGKLEMKKRKQFATKDVQEPNPKKMCGQLKDVFANWTKK